MPKKMDRIVIGLMSGTSADGIDAVACRVAGRGLDMRAKVLTHVHRSYPADIRGEVLAIAAGRARAAEAFLRLDLVLGKLNADAAAATIRRAGLKREDVSLIACHGQTISHLPPIRGRKDAGTWQLGQTAIIAVSLGIRVVGNFREADMAVGGQGAPLVPWTDYVLLRDRRTSRAVQNVGGIGNVSYLPAGGGPESVQAFDTGPGNMVMDGLVGEFTQGKQQYDTGGRRAARGKVNERLLCEWLSHPFFKQSPPKSCGREEFGLAFCRPALKRYARRCSPDDFIATATALTARSIAQGYQRWLPRDGIDELVICGGGGFNRTLIRMMATELPTVRIRHIDEFGIAPQAKEPLSFALLGCACVDGIPANLPQVTGARRVVVLGQIVPAL